MDSDGGIALDSNTELHLVAAMYPGKIIAKPSNRMRNLVNIRTTSHSNTTRADVCEAGLDRQIPVLPLR